MEGYSPDKIENGLYEKQKRWEATRERINRITDNLGLGIDEEIKDGITTLNVLGFSTDSSCAGHKTEEDGYGTPYIQVSAPAPIEWWKDANKKKAWEQENLRQKAQLQTLLEEFNKNRETVEEARIYFSDMGYGSFRLQSIGVDEKEHQPKTVAEAVKKIALYQQEMTEFMEYLKKRFLNDDLSNDNYRYDQKEIFYPIHKEDVSVKNGRIRKTVNEIRSLQNDAISDDESFASEASAPQSINRKRKASDTSQNNSSPTPKESRLGKKGKSWKELFNEFLSKH